MKIGNVGNQNFGMAKLGALKPVVQRAIEEGVGYRDRAYGFMVTDCLDAIINNFEKGTFIKNGDTFSLIDPSRKGELLTKTKEQRRLAIQTLLDVADDIKDAAKEAKKLKPFQ